MPARNLSRLPRLLEKSVVGQPGSVLQPAQETVQQPLKNQFPFRFLEDLDFLLRHAVFPRSR